MRARNIKPSFFSNDKLLECSSWSRLLFIGLWMIADREGRLEDRAKKIKILLFPGDNVDVESSLNELEERDFIVRYVVNGKRYIQVVNFLEYQHPHPKEPRSEIPPPPEKGLSSSGEFPRLGNEIPRQNNVQTISDHEIPRKEFEGWPKSRDFPRQDNDHSLTGQYPDSNGTPIWNGQNREEMPISFKTAFLNEEENEPKEKEERSKEEREGEFLSPEGKNTLFSPEREKEKESREGEKEKTPLLSEAFSSFALPHRGEGGPSPGRSSPEGEGTAHPDDDPALPSERCGTEKEDITPRRRKRAGNAPSQGPPLLKEGKQESFSYPKDFEAFWSAYPRRIEKRRAFRAWQARLREGTAPQTLISCARNYAEYVLLKDTAECYIKHPATFLGPDRPFEDWREKRVDKATIPKWSRAAQACIALAEKYEREEENGREDLNLLSL